MQTIFATKIVFNRSLKSYECVTGVIDSASMGAHAANGFLVFDDYHRAIGLVVTGKFASHLKDAQKQAFLNHLFAGVGSNQQVYEAGATLFQSRPFIAL